MTTRNYASVPLPKQTYPKIIKSLLPIVGNKKNQGSKNTLPEVTYLIKSLEINQENLKDYRRICGFANTGQVPPTYFSVLSQALQMNMMVDEPFPFAMLGLVHIANSVTQYRRIADTEIVSLQVSLGNLQDHDKGKQFDFITQVHSGEALIWEGTSTYLSRQKTEGNNNKVKPIKEIVAKPVVKKDDMHHIFALPEDLGRRYAMVSGDFNLIHLHPLTAKAFGFPKAIAHGMWSKAKCLSLMDLPEAYTVDVTFKLPIYLPSEVELIGDTMEKLAATGKSMFDLYSAADDKPHLAGKITLV